MAILTLNKYKTIKNITSTDRDASITEVITSVNSFVSSYCNRSFTDYFATDKTEYFDGTSTEIFPEVFPLVSVTSVKTSSDGGLTYATTLAEYTDYVVDMVNSRVISANLCFINATIPTNSVEVIYKAGYAKVPDDVVMAAAHLVEYFLDEQYTPKKAFSGVTIENLSVMDGSSKLPAHIRRVLDHYRSLEF